MRNKIPILIVFLLVGTCATIYGQAYPDRHTTSLRDSWISCDEAPNPNITRGEGHWIMYDLKTTYALTKSKFWNCNNPEYLDAGMRDIMIDYSIDGTNWEEWGRYDLQRANASSTYQGEDGPDFDSTVARYVLITAVSNYGSSCTGLSEFKVAVSPVTISNNEDLTLDLNIIPTPNPFSDLLSIDLTGEIIDGMRYQVTTLDGKIMMGGLVRSNRLQLDGSQLAPGQYNLSIVHQSGMKTISITKI